MTLARRRLARGLVLALGAVAGLAPVAAPGGGFDRDAVRKDVEFLLETLEQKCGHFFDRKGVDWKAVEREFRGAWKDVANDVEHVRLVERIVARVRDGHAGIAEIHFEWPESEQEARKGVGLSLGVSGKQVVVKDCFGPAQAAGVRSGFVVKSIDDRPALKWLEERVEGLRDARGYSTAQGALFAACHHGMADVPGTSFRFDFKEGRKSHRKTLTCGSGGGNGVPFGPIFPPEDARAIDRQSYGTLADGRIGWIHVRQVPAELPDQLDRMLADLREVEGLVLDFRANTGGGVDHEAVFGRFLAPGEAYGPWKASEEGEHFTGPLVVIVDGGTCSAAETLSGRLKSERRAYLLGPSATAGMSGKKETLELPSGRMSVLVTVQSYFAGDEIEGIGVTPHEIVPFDVDLLLRGVDPFLHRAVEILEEGLPPEAVRYRGH